MNINKQEAKAKERKEAETTAKRVLDRKRASDKVMKEMKEEEKSDKSTEEKTSKSPEKKESIS